MALTKLAFLCGVLLIGHIAGAKDRRDFEKKFDLDGKGESQVRLTYLFFGEPQGNPGRLRIAVKCKGSKSWVDEQEYDLCSVQHFEYDQKSMTMHVKFISGEANPYTGVAHCDIPNDEEIPLAGACKTPPPPPPPQ